MMKIKRIISLAVCMIFILLQISAYAAQDNVTYSVGSEDSLPTQELFDYARLPDVTAGADSWNSQSYTPMQALVEHDNYFWYAASGQYLDALTVNLNRPVSVKYIQILMLRRYSGSYDGVKVEYSANGIDYTEACVNTEVIRSDSWLNIEFASPADMQYVRISNADYNRPAVKYIKVWGEQDSMLDVTDAADGNIAGIDTSPAAGDYAAELMFDNEYAKASAYASAKSDTVPYITVELSTPKVITAVALCPHVDFPDSAGEFSVSLSKDGTNWEEIAAYSGGEELRFGSMNIIKTEKTGEYSYIKISKPEGFDTYAEGSLAFAEMKLISDCTAKRFWVKGFSYTTNPSGLYANDGDYASDMRIEFSEDVAPGSITCDSLQMICGEEKQDFEFEVDGSAVIIEQNQFKSDSEYELVATTAICAADGTPLMRSSSVKLTTGTIYNIENDGRSKLINAALNKPVQYNKVIGLYGTSTEEELKQINDGNANSGPILPSSSGTVYYFIDMMNVYDTVSITLGERSLGYQSDTANSFVAGSMTMPPVKEDGTIDVEQMDIIYSVSTPLEANEVRTVMLDEVKPYRYVAVYRTGGSAMCFTEFGLTAKAEINSTDGWIVSKSVSGENTNAELGITADIYVRDGLSAKLIIAAFDENDKMIFMDIKEENLTRGNNIISESVTVPSENCTIRAALVEMENGMRMLFDGVEF